jgi:hypothetical protein
MISSEESYLNDLRYLDTFWRNEFKSSNLFKEAEFRTMFSYISKILKTHEDYLNHLKTPPIKYAGMFGCRFLNICQSFLVRKIFISDF